MPSPIVKERSDLPSPKRQKTEEGSTCGDSDSEGFDSDECTDEEMRLFNQELLKNGGFEIDFNKFRYCFGWKAMDLDDYSSVRKPRGNRDFIAMLLNLALTKHNAEKQTNLQLGNIFSANYRLSTGIALYIQFEVNDPSDGNQTKPYRAVVRYLPGDIEVVSCEPKPSS